MHKNIDAIIHSHSNNNAVDVCSNYVGGADGSGLSSSFVGPLNVV